MELTAPYLRPHQQEALRKLSNGKILWGGVGSGKTAVAVEYYMLREAPRDVYVITTAKKRDDFDWPNEFYRVNVAPKDRYSGVRGSGKNKKVSRKEVSGVSDQLSHHEQHGANHGLEEGLDDGSRVGGDTSERPAPEGSTYPYVLTVDSWNNIAKYADVAGAFFIFDEQRLVGSGQWTRKFLRIAKHNRWILLSATPGDTWMDYVPVFVANNFYKNRSEFIREHVVYNSFTKFPKVDRYINVGRLARNRSQLLVEMPFMRHTRRRHVEVDLHYDKETLDLVLKKRWHVYEERPLRDIAEMFLVGRRVVNSDPSRLEMVCELWKQHPKLIVFYNFNYELESLRSLKEYYEIDSPASVGTVAVNRSRATTTSALSLGGEISTAIAEWNGHKHQPIPTTDRWLYLVQYTAGAEGWNCIDTDAMVMYSRNYSWKVTEQAYGRIDRLNTSFTDLWYYGFTTDSFIDKAIGRSLRAKEDFNVLKYRRMFDLAG